MPTDTKTKKDNDYVEWTKERFDRSIGFKDLPESLQVKLSAIQEASRKRRGLQKAPTKELISVRLSPDVLSALRATGDGWQTLIDDTLRRHFVKP
jgi:uncharacterized protein (DUF4415 family)